MAYITAEECIEKLPEPCSQVDISELVDTINEMENQVNGFLEENGVLNFETSMINNLFKSGCAYWVAGLLYEKHQNTEKADYYFKRAKQILKSYIATYNFPSDKTPSQTSYPSVQGMEITDWHDPQSIIKND